jgi:cellulose synthase/poly-beta-1,6-N-acetylglucosamine synthase-like glycosyltransferase
VSPFSTSLPGLDSAASTGCWRVGNATDLPGTTATQLRPPEPDLLGIGQQRLFDAVERHFRDRLLDAAIHALERTEPQFSARPVVTKRQRWLFAALLGLVALTLILAPASSGSILMGVLSLWFAANALFRALLVWVGAKQARAEPLPPLSPRELPVYSILVPLYREANVLPTLIGALKAIDYPANLIDAKLIVEADDTETIGALESLDLDARFHVIRVPASLPRTKPKACNYAMPFVRGEFVVIYDAEDRPETDQLRKAVSAFRAMPREVACLQARLNFYNANENWLTRMFALDYGLWFDFLLPGLDRMGIPMPLGGTSNHFRSEALRAIHGWDPFNVTEDADIGIRLARQGFRVHTLDSTTFEEATTGFGNWLRQRSRWQKGYILTWLVHMRNPFELLRNAGWWGFLGFQLFVGGTFVSALLNPILWAFVLAASLVGAPLFAAGHICVACLIIGNGFFICLAMLGSCRRGWLGLAPYGLMAPLYWGLISLAGYRGLWQLVGQPWHWEKTQHGVSRHFSAGS